jgi:hypothetical protein
MSTPDRQNTLPADQDGMQIDDNQQEEVEEEPTDKTGPQEKDVHDAAGLDARASVAAFTDWLTKYAGTRADGPRQSRAVSTVPAPEKFSGEGKQLWELYKLKLTSYLNALDVQRTDWADRAYMFLSGKADRYFSNYLAREKITAKDVSWETFDDLMAHGPFRLAETQLNLRNQLAKMKFRPGADLTHHISIFNEVVSKCGSMDDHSAVWYYVGTLPEALQAQLYHDPTTYKDWESLKKCQERSITIWGRVGNSIFDNTSAHPNKRFKFTPRFRPQPSTQGPPAHKVNAVKKLEVDKAGRKVTPEAFAYRKRKGLCAYCENKGHRYTECPDLQNRQGEQLQLHVVAAQTEPEPEPESEPEPEPETATKSVLELADRMAQATVAVCAVRSDPDPAQHQARTANSGPAGVASPATDHTDASGMAVTRQTVTPDLIPCSEPDLAVHRLAAASLQTHMHHAPESEGMHTTDVVLADHRGEAEVRRAPSGHDHENGHLRQATAGVEHKPPETPAEAADGADVTHSSAEFRSVQNVPESSGNFISVHDEKSDRMIHPEEFAYLERLAGCRFTVDCCANPDGDNALVNRYFSADNSFLDTDQMGKEMLFINPPYEQIDAFVEHYLHLKTQNPSLGAVLLLPRWHETNWWQKVQQLEKLTVFRKGYRLFTQPSENGRRRCGPIPWPVHAFIDRPDRPTPRLFAVTETELLFQIPCTISGVKTDAAIAGTALLDSGATPAALVNVKLLRQLNLRDTLTRFQKDRVTLANGDETESYGNVSLKLRFKGFTCNVDAIVVDLADDFQVILGQEWLSKQKAKLDYEQKTVTLKQRDKVRRLSARSSNQLASLRVNASAQQTSTTTAAPARHHYLSAAKVKRYMRKGHKVFLADVRQVGQADEDQSSADIDAFRTQIQSEFADVFVSELPSGLPPERPAPRAVPLEPGSRPTFRNAYRYSPRETEEMKKQIEEGLKSGVIQPSTSPFGAPVLFVQKKDGSLRMCVDYRQLNKITIRNKYPLPRIDDLLDRLAGARYYSTLDLKAGYNQIRLSEDDVHTTAFNTPFGHYEFRVLPFGLTNAPAVFQTVMNDTLRPFLGRFALVYLDDIIVYSKTTEEHAEHLRQVLQCLRKHKFFANNKKCNLFAPQVEFLGHIVSAEGLKVDPKKTAVVAAWPTPANKKELQQFLGFANFFRRFIKNYSRIAAPMTKLTGNVPFTPDAAFHHAFETLKQALVSPPVLKLPEFDKPFTVVVDASDKAVGGILLQENRPIAFESRMLTSAERNYPTHDRECLAIVHAYTIWRCYLEGVESSCITDHKPLQFLQEQPQLSRRQMRWLEFLASFRPKMVYRPGATNPADWLSRPPSESLSASGTWDAHHNSVASQDTQVWSPLVELPSSWSRLAILSTCNSVSRPSAALKGKPLATPTETYQDLFKVGYKVDNWYQKPQNLKGLQELEGLYYTSTGRLAVPESVRPLILKECHDAPYAGHFGVKKTLQAVQKNYWWPQWRQQVTEHVRTCGSCQRVKSVQQKPGGTLQPLPAPEAPWDSISTDFIVELPLTESGKNAVWVIVDRLTKMTHLVPCTTNITAEGAAELFMSNVYRLHGMPKQMVCDRDPRWTSQFWRQVSASLQMDVSLSSSFHPQTDGQTERVNRVLEDVLRHFVSPTKNDWDKLLPAAEFALNSAQHESTQATPFELNYGFKPSSPLDVALGNSKLSCPAAANLRVRLHDAIKHARDCIHAAQQRYKKWADKRRIDVTYKPDQKVLVNVKNMNIPSAGNKKLFPRYVGPFRVVKVINDVAVKLELPEHMKCHDVFHISLIKPWHPDSRDPKPPAPVLVEGEWEFVVEAVLSHRLQRRKGGKDKLFYLVKWQGEDESQNTWEPEENLTSDGKYENTKVLEYWATVENTIQARQNLRKDGQTKKTEAKQAKNTPRTVPRKRKTEVPHPEQPRKSQRRSRA